METPIKKPKNKRTKKQRRLPPSIGQLYNWAISFTKMSKHDLLYYEGKLDPNDKELFKGWFSSNTVKAFSTLVDFVEETQEESPEQETRPPNLAFDDNTAGPSKERQEQSDSNDDSDTDMEPSKTGPSKERQEQSDSDDDSDVDMEPSKAGPSQETSTVKRKKNKRSDKSDFTTIKKLLNENSKSCTFSVPETIISNPSSTIELVTDIKNQLAKVYNSVFESNQARYTIACNLLKLSNQCRTGFYPIIKKKFKISRR